MKPTPKTASGSRAGFSLIEMIGVMAIMAILATILVPNILKSMDLAAVRAESESLKNLAAQVARYTADVGTAPTSANWNTVLQSYSDVTAAELTNNKRQRPRVFLWDASTNRAMILSVMSNNAALSLPLALNSANFQTVWGTAENTIPNPVTWAGWSAWNSSATSHQYLLIQRINLGAELQTFPIALKNSGPGIVDYEVVNAGASSGTRLPLGSGANLVPVLQLRPKQRLNLYISTTALTPSYTYVVSTTGKSFDFNGTIWSSQ